MPVAATRAETALVVYLNESVADHEVPDLTDAAAETDAVPASVTEATVAVVAAMVKSVAEAVTIAPVRFSAALVVKPATVTV